jgi:hypothetical protein
MAGTGITRFTEFAANRDDNRRRLEESLRAEKLAKQKLAIEIASQMIQQEQEAEQNQARLRLDEMQLQGINDRASKELYDRYVSGLANGAEFMKRVPWSSNWMQDRNELFKQYGDTPAPQLVSDNAGAQPGFVPVSQWEVEQKAKADKEKQADVSKQQTFARLLGDSVGSGKMTKEYAESLWSMYYPDVVLPEGALDTGLEFKRKQLKDMDTQRRQAWMDAYRYRSGQALNYYRDLNARIQAAGYGIDLGSVGIPQLPDPAEYSGDPSALMRAAYPNEPEAGNVLNPAPVQFVPGTNQARVTVTESPMLPPIPAGNGDAFLTGLSNRAEYANQKNELDLQKKEADLKGKELDNQRKENPPAKPKSLVGPQAKALALSEGEKFNAAKAGFTSEAMLKAPNLVRKTMLRDNFYISEENEDGEMEQTTKLTSVGKNLVKLINRDYPAVKSAPKPASKPTTSNQSIAAKEAAAKRSYKGYQLDAGNKSALAKAIQADKKAGVKASVVAPDIRKALRAAGVPASDIEHITITLMNAYYHNKR